MGAVKEVKKSSGRFSSEFSSFALEENKIRRAPDTEKNVPGWIQRAESARVLLRKMPWQPLTKTEVDGVATFTSR